MFLELRKKKNSSVRLYTHELHVYRDWMYGFFVLVVLFIAFGVVHAVIFLRTQSNTLFGFIPEVNTTVPSISREKFRAAKDIVVKRQEIFDSAKTASVPADPSVRK